jgi:hypothetical protein
MCESRDSVARAVMDADAVINLVGSFDNMDAVQNVGAGIVAQAAAAAGVKALVHVSAIGADARKAKRYMGRARQMAKPPCARRSLRRLSFGHPSSLAAKTNSSIALPE